jgi:hypothetical protein
MGKHLPIVSTATLALVAILFLLPFINLECGGQRMFVLTGIDLVTGFSYKAPSLDQSQLIQQGHPNEFAIAAFLSSILGVLFVLAVRENLRNVQAVSVVASAITSICLLLLQIQLRSKIQDQSHVMMVRLNFEIGYWLCLIIPIGLIVVVVLSRIQQREYPD